MKPVPRRRLRRPLIIAALTAVGLAVALMPAQAALAATAAPAAAAAAIPTGPAGDDFYTVPNPLPAGAPGDVIRARQINATQWQVMYLSTNALGQRNAVTGSVLVPKGKNLATVPIVGFAVGTQGPAFRCVASKALAAGILYEIAAVNDSLNAGFAVAVTDYEGYSKTTTPTYITGRSEGPAVLDSVRAAMRLPQAGLGTGNHKVIVQGYSQGGGASLWAAELWPTYAPELNLVGAVAGGVPADLTETAKTLDGGFFGFLAFAAVGLDTAYPELKLDNYLNAKGKTTLDAARANDCLVEISAKYLGNKISDYTTTNPLSTPAWQARLAQNKLGFAPPKVPVYQYHGLFDEIVPFAQADALHKTYCKAGVKESWNVYPFSEHTLGIFQGQLASGLWIKDRFAGKPAPVNC